MHAPLRFSYAYKGDPCNMDHLRIYLQIIVKFQLASENYAPSYRPPQSTFKAHLRIVLNGVQYVGKKRDNDLTVTVHITRHIV